FFIDDIIGMTVVSEEGEPIGTVKDILQTPANDVWVVQNGTKEVLLPAVKEVIKTVDLKRKEVVIHVMEGLLD
ncbi:MAG: 16S rRNA processing protein RimM, partial [Ignavibacteriales bacterium]|nr:16S rRNA processing protein RimM [Ignavibacteriales bacterium]